MRRSIFTPLALSGAMSLSLLATGCGDRGQPAAIQQRVTLESFASCEALESYIEETAIRDMQLTLDSQKGDGWRGGGIFAAEDAAAPNASAGSAKSGPSAYTKTNTQVAGVDEADFVKNDGTRIFMISGQQLYAVKSWPANQMSIAGKLSLEGYPTQMYLDDKNRVVVFSSVYTKYDGFSGGGGGGVADAACAGGCYYNSNTTKITVIDVSDLANPTVKHQFYLPGSYSNSRRIDGSIRVVLRDDFRWPDKIRFYPEYTPGLYEDKGRLSAALDALKASNEQLIREQTLDQWLPNAKRKLADGSVVDVARSCSDFHKSNAPVHLGMATVATLNLDQIESGPTRTTIMGEVGEIYASTSSLYVASPHWWWWPELGQKDWTYLHKFDITDKNKAHYVASGGAEGHIVDQFSMDEDKGFFRIATTISTRVPDEMNPKNTWGRLETTNRVSVLREVSGQLALTGQTEDLAKGERIYSSRFIGDRGFVVTFRQVDPLYTIDLSNPVAPRRVGELKVPGFSSYIHPLDDTHLLTMGVYLPDPNGGTPNGNERRLQLSMFDVSDFANPKQTFTQLVGTAYGWSEANYDHKAFNYFPERKMLAIPFSDYVQSAGGDPWGSFVSELRVFDISTTAGITPRGAVSMKDVYISAGTPEWYYWYSPWIRRSVMATDMGSDFIYAVSDAGIRAVSGSSLSTPLATTIFPRTPFKY